MTVAVGMLRVEVQAAPIGGPLSTWKPAEGSAGRPIEVLVGALAGALGALQARGLAHFAVRPQNIFVTDTADGPRFVLGGLEAVALVEQSGLMAVTVDPFYAPPEAAGLFQHSPGAGLLAWDWWSFGRVVQERVLGKHVLGVILQRDVARATPELNARAEALLLERDASGPRAGAVEAMPTTEPRTVMLLRGLLTSSRDGRWNGTDVQRWLAGENVSDYYRLPRGERLFRWRERSWTVAEVADQLRTTATPAEAVTHVWEVEKPGTLVKFLADTADHRMQSERHAEVLKLAAATALKSLKVEAVREMIAALALMELVGGNLVWRGHRMLAENFEKVFGGETFGPEAMGLLDAFTARPIILFIEHSDLAAARALGDLAETVGAAEMALRRLRLLGERDAVGRARLCHCVLKSAAELRAIVDEMHATYACTTLTELNKIFQQPKLTRAEMAALAWTADKAAGRGFLTHRQWGERELARLRTSGAEQAAVLLWLRLAEALAVGPLVFGQWRIFVPFWLMLGLPIAFVWPGPRGLIYGLAPAVSAIVLRFLVSRRLRGRLQVLVPKIAAWRWRDGRARCRAELRTLSASGRTKASVEAAMVQVNEEIAGLTMLETRPKPNAAAPHFRVIATLSWASLILAAGLVGFSAWRIKVEKPTWPKFVVGWREALPKKEVPLTEEQEAEKAGRPIKVSWPYKASDDPQEWHSSATMEASKDQVKFANARGRAVVEPYKLPTVKTLIFMRVPTEDKFGIMIYDGQRQQLQNTRVFILDFSPMPRSYIKIDEKYGIYLPD